jgi:hypothetical protein
MYGYNDAEWNAAKEEIKSLLTARAAQNEMPISYSEMAASVHSIRFSPEEYAYHHILGEVSEEEDAAGRGMLSAMVVHKHDSVPGPGFFVLAKKLGRDTSDRDNCWGEEMKLVYASAQPK